MKSFRRVAYAVLLAGTVAAAQPDSSPASLSPQPKASAKVLSSAEMRDGANAIAGQIKDDYQHVLRLQDIARKQKDVIKLNCVNDKLVQVKAQMNIAESGSVSLRSALDKGSDAQALYDQVTASGTTIKELRESANSCIGETELSKKDSGIEVTRPDVPDDPGTIDPTRGPGDLGSFDPPGYASPYH